MSLPELSNTQIDRFFTYNPQYMGCHPKNHLPSPKALDGHFCVVNLQSSTQGSGTHWTLLYDVSPHSILYFDSMGEVPPTEVQRIMNASGKSQSYNTHDFQPINTTSCGWWCMYVAKALLSGQTLTTIQRHFTGSVGHSEELLKHHFSNRTILSSPSQV